MENHYQPPIMVLKKTGNPRFFVKPLAVKRAVKKIIILFTTILFPWLIIYKLRLSLKKVRDEALVLSQAGSVNLFTGTKGLGVFQRGNQRDYLRLDEIAGMLHWPELINELERKNGFGELLRLLSVFHAENDTVSNPSRCWVLLAAKNCDQLLKQGYDNFKRTIGHNYFNFLVQKGDPQIKAAEQAISPALVEVCRKAARAMPNDPVFQTKDQFSYYYFNFLLWEYAKKIDVSSYLDKLEEPQEGSPILVHSQGKSMSQDLANSVIEYYSIEQVVPFKKMKTVLEIGDGYGRNAHVILSLNPKIKLVLVDILPALYIAQRYLSSVFKDRKVFQAKNFDNYQEVKEEIEAASIVFLLPHQLTLLPANYFDLSMNISSFGEMSVDQIDWYFEQINRLTRGYFYTKQWNESKNPFDDLVLRKADYPYRSQWKEIYSRDCVIQREFFETLFQVMD